VTHGTALLTIGNRGETRSRETVVVQAVLSPPIPTLANEILPQLHRKAFKRGAHFR
jgi:hypothetical protein